MTNPPSNNHTLLKPLVFPHSNLAANDCLTLDWNELKKFYYVVQQGGFSKAAVYLGTSQPAISRTMQQLEQSLGEQLLIRSSRKVILTRAGELAFHAVSQAFMQLEVIKQSIEEDKTNMQGLMRIWVDNGLLSCYLRTHLQNFMELYPYIRLKVYTSQTLPDFDLLEADVAICPTLPNRHNLIQEPLLVNHPKLYAHSDYLDKFGTPQTPEDLDQHRLIA